MKNYYITLAGKRSTLAKDFQSLEQARNWLIDYVIAIHGSAKLDWHATEHGAKLTSPNFLETYEISTVNPSAIVKEASLAKAQNPL
jgi:hypothetical protein